MKQRYKTYSLAIMLLIFAFLPAVHYQYVTNNDDTRHSAFEEDFESAQGPLAEMKIPISEDESVVSNLSGTNFHGNTASGGLFVGLEAIDGWSR